MPGLPPTPVRTPVPPPAAPAGPAPGAGTRVRAATRDNPGSPAPPRSRHAEGGGHAPSRRTRAAPAREAGGNERGPNEPPARMITSGRSGGGGKERGPPAGAGPPDRRWGRCLPGLPSRASGRPRPSMHGDRMCRHL